MSLRPLPSMGRRRPDVYDAATILLLAGLAALVASTFDAYAVSNDEGVQQRYGELIIRYYESGFADKSVFQFDNLYLYGGLFDVLATLLARALPFDLYTIRHILCAIIGIGGIAATAATARLIAGARAGLIAAIALAVCGSWYGGMFNHTKDVTFAAAMMGATCMVLPVMRDLPRPRARDIAFTGLLLGAALGLRALGLMLLVYGGAALLAEAAYRDSGATRERLAFVARSLLVLSPALVIGYLIMIAAWPWAALNVFNPVRAIFAFTHFQYPIKTLLAGQVYTMADVPRWYVPAYLLIKLPLLMLGGAAIALLFAAAPKLSRLTARARRETALVALTAAFPVLLHVIDHGPAFTGLRHFLFVVPPLAVLAGIGCDALIARLTQWRPIAAAGAAAAIAALFAGNALTLVRLHPYEYLFYNPIVGGLEGAANRYETDYWVNIMPEAVHALEASLARADATGRPSLPYYVAVCAERVQFEAAAGPRLRWTNDWSKADFFIAPTHMHCDRLMDGKVIVSIKRLDTLIGVVKDRRALVHPGIAQNATSGPLHP